MQRVAILMPAYNEEKRIGKTLDAYIKFFNLLKKRDILDYELMVVINNTKDRTREIVKSFMNKENSVKCMDLLKKGKGYAVIEGIKHYITKDFDLIGFVDADMATSPEEYLRVINAASTADGAIADRYMPGSIMHPAPTIQRLFVKRLFNFLIRVVLLVPFKDTQCGAKVFKRKALERVLNKLSMSQWAFDAELLYHLDHLKFRIISVPTKWFDKEYSTINFWKSGPWMAMAIVRLRIINSPFKRFVKIYDNLIGLIPR